MHRGRLICPHQLLKSLSNVALLPGVSSPRVESSRLTMSAPRQEHLAHLVLLGCLLHAVFSFLLPRLEAIHKTAVLEPMNDTSGLDLHRNLFLGVLLP